MRRRGFHGNPQRGRGSRPNVPPALAEANQLFVNGNYLAAAQVFERFAQRARARGGQGAGRFALRAGEAYLMAGDVSNGMPLVESGVSALASVGKLDVLSRIGKRLLQELAKHGQTTEAEQVTDLLSQHVPDFSATSSALGPAGRPALPENCPGCGASLHPDEVEWLDNSTAECDYCGSAIRAE